MPPGFNGIRKITHSNRVCSACWYRRQNNLPKKPRLWCDCGAEAVHRFKPQWGEADWGTLDLCQACYDLEMEFQAEGL
jgi:hypothetical protein